MSLAPVLLYIFEFFNKVYQSINLLDCLIRNKLCHLTSTRYNKVRGAFPLFVICQVVQNGAKILLCFGQISSCNIIHLEYNKKPRCGVFFGLADLCLLITVSNVSWGVMAACSLPLCTEKCMDLIQAILTFVEAHIVLPFNCDFNNLKIVYSREYVSDLHEADTIVFITEQPAN